MKWGLLSSLRHIGYTVSPIPAWIQKSCQRFDHVALVFFRAKIVRSGNVSFLCLRAKSSATTIHAQSASGCWTCSVGRVLLSTQGSHPATRELKPCVPVEAFLSWGHLDVDGFLEQQLSGVPGYVNHCGLIPFDGMVVLRPWRLYSCHKSTRRLPVSAMQQQRGGMPVPSWSRAENCWGLLTAITVLSCAPKDSFLLCRSASSTWGAPKICHQREAALFGGAAIHSRRRWRRQVGVWEVWNEGDRQGWTNTTLSADQGEGRSTSGEEGQGGVPNPLQLWQELHWWDQEKTGDQAERTPRGLPVRDPGEICSSVACMEEPPCHQMGWDYSGWHSQAPQRAAAQGSHPHPDDPSWGMLQQDMSSLDARWLPWEDRRTRPTEQVQHPLTDCARIMIADDAARRHKL